MHRLVVVALVMTMALAPATWAQPSASQVLRWNVGTDFETLDPAKSTGIPEATVIYLLYEGLTQRDPQGRLVPGMAERWDVSKDGLTWTFYLRAAKWSNGQLVSAGDFEFAWKRALDPALAADYAYQLYYLKNGKAYNTGGIKDVSQVGVIAKDARTLVVTLESPTPFFGDLLSFHTLMPVPKTVVTGTPAWAGKPETFVGNGPFVMKEWTRQNRVVLERNPNYWDAKNIKLQRIEFSMIEAESTALVQYEAGQLDGSSNVPVADIPRLLKTGDFKAMPYIGTYYYLFNTTHKPLDDARVRRALAFAINRTLITARITRAGEKPANAFVPSGIVVNGTDFRQAGGPLMPVYDPALAKKLLAEAGYPNGITTELWWPNRARPYLTQPQKIAEAIQAQLAKGGIRAKLVTYEWGTYLAKLKDGEQPMAIIGWIGDNGDPDNFLYVLLDKDNAVKGKANNYAFYTSEAVHTLLINGQRVNDQAKRGAYYRQAQEIIHSDAPWVPLVHAARVGAHRKEVQNFTLHPLQIWWLHRVWISK